MYFNYHAKAKRLISEGHLVHYDFVDKWGRIRPALVLYFDNEKPMPLERISSAARKKIKHQFFEHFSASTASVNMRTRSASAGSATSST